MAGALGLDGGGCLGVDASLLASGLVRVDGCALAGRGGRVLIYSMCVLMGLAWQAASPNSTNSGHELVCVWRHEGATFKLDCLR